MLTETAGNIQDEKIILPQIFVAFKDPKSYFTAIIYGALGLGVASVTSFLPTFIKEFGFDPCKSDSFISRLSEANSQ
jgi:hypothetical protein